MYQKILVKNYVLYLKKEGELSCVRIYPRWRQESTFSIYSIPSFSVKMCIINHLSSKFSLKYPNEWSQRPLRRLVTYLRHPEFIITTTCEFIDNFCYCFYFTTENGSVYMPLAGLKVVMSMKWSMNLYKSLYWQLSKVFHLQRQKIWPRNRQGGNVTGP